MNLLINDEIHNKTLDQINNFNLKTYILYIFMIMIYKL